MRSMNLQDLRHLLTTIEAEIECLPNGPAREKNLELRSEIKTSIEAHLWAMSPGLRSPSA